MQDGGRHKRNNVKVKPPETVGTAAWLAERQKHGRGGGGEKSLSRLFEIRSDLSPLSQQPRLSTMVVFSREGGEEENSASRLEDRTS